MRTKILGLLILVIWLSSPIHAASAAPLAVGQKSTLTFTTSLVDVTNNKVTFNFPETATFSAQLTASAAISAVTLEYGDEEQTCGQVIAEAFPQFTPAKTVDVEWTWDMRQSGSLPPGASLWWRWRYIDEAGQEYVSDTQQATWLDDIHDWQSISSGNLRLHWYGSDKAFAQTMLDAGLEGLKRNEEQAGLVTAAQVNIYVYPNYRDMRDAVLYEPSWTGGQAYPEHNIVIMGISTSDSAWNQDAIIHELTHVLIGHFTFSCIGSVPAWLNEGLAMFSEGDLDSGTKAQLDQAIQSNTLIAVRSLSGGFSELPDKADISYSESYSVVKFMIDIYGRQKMTNLLIALREAKPVDTALLEVYGFDTDGLEDAWRKAVGAGPRAVSDQAVAQPTPTLVPTFVPISGAAGGVTPTPDELATSSLSNARNPSTSGPSFWLTLALVGSCGVLVIITGLTVRRVVVHSQKRKGVRNG